MNRVKFFILYAILASLPAQAQFEDVTIRTTHLGGAVYMLEGRGGNLAVLSGEDGVLLVDDQYAPLSDKILAAIREFDSGPIRFVINTHWHVDHTQGNEILSGQGAVIVAHDNVRERMSTEQFMASINRKFPPSPEGALPVVTFNDRLTFHFNGETVAAWHVPRAHTDGDVILHFPDANVIHMGDNFWTGQYPLVDRSSGGSVQGMIDAVQGALPLCRSGTKVIPGHGPLGNCADLESFGQMLSDATARIRALIDQGKNLEEVIEARPNADFDETLGGGFIKPERFTEFVYNSILDERR